MGLLEDKVVLITGGTSGIGRASAVLFAKKARKWQSQDDTKQWAKKSSTK
jgi:NAD(P)-dependent dehydrogenase (short-subunit alcohol dehydrogenase family)